MNALDTLLLLGQGLTVLAILGGACALATWSDNRGRARRLLEYVPISDEPYEDPNEGLTDLEAHLRP